MMQENRVFWNITYNSHLIQEIVLFCANSTMEDFTHPSDFSKKERDAVSNKVDNDVYMLRMVTSTTK